MRDCSFDHIGYTVSDIKSTARMLKSFGYIVTEQVTDERLQVELCYLSKANSADIELVRQLNPESLERQLLAASGVQPYHVAFSTSKFDEVCRELSTQGYEQLFEPVGVEAFGGNRICYFKHPDIGYVELLEK